MVDFIRHDSRVKNALLNVDFWSIAINQYQVRDGIGTNGFDAELVRAAEMVTT
jgi:hypothetical protein